MKNLRKKILATTTLFLVLTIAAAMFVIPYSSAQGVASTPSDWIERIISTPNGAYREASGITDYPLTTSPSGNEPKTGYSEGPSPLTNHTLWRADVAIHHWTPILADNGKVFVGSMMDHGVYCLDENTGELIWHYNMSGSVYRWPQLAYHLYFIRDYDTGTSFALSQNTGVKAYAPDLASRSEMPDMTGWSPALSVTFPQVFYNADAIYFTSRNNVTCLKLEHSSYPTIEYVWNRDTIRGRLSYWDGKLYGTRSYSRWVSCVNASTGDLIWNFTGTDDPEDMFYPSPTLAYGNVYLGTENDGSVERCDNVVCLDAETGEYKWTYETGEYFVESVSAAYGNIYIAGGERNAVHCVDGETGEKKWEFNAPGFVDYYDIQIGDGRLYFTCAAIQVSGFPVPGTFPSLVMCVDAYTGTEIWRYYIDRSCTNIALVDGKVLTQSDEDYVWCWGKGPTTTTAAVTSQTTTLDQGTVIYGSVEDMSPFSQQHPELQNPWVDGVPVVLSYVSDGSWTDFATVNTDSAGTFSYTWTPPSEGVYTVVARFEGNDAYYWSSDKTTVQIEPTPTSGETDLTPLENSVSDLEDSMSTQTMYILVILVLVIIAIVIGIYSVLKSRK